MEILIRDHLASARMVDIFRQLTIRLDPGRATAAERLLRAAAEKSPTAEARGLATFKLADLLDYRARAVRDLRGPEPDPCLRLSELIHSDNRETAMAPAEDPDSLEREAVQLYDLVVRLYADNSGRGGRKLGEPAAQALFQFRELAVGRPAPEVEGLDVKGKASTRRWLPLWRRWNIPWRRARQETAEPLILRRMGPPPQKDGRRPHGACRSGRRPNGYAGRRLRRIDRPRGRLSRSRY